MTNTRPEPKQYMCIDGMMQIVDFGGQFVTVRAYQDLLRRYKKLIKLARIKGILDSVKPTQKKINKIFSGDAR
jgi:hypothetical protein